MSANPFLSARQEIERLKNVRWDDGPVHAGYGIAIDNVLAILARICNSVEQDQRNLASIAYKDFESVKELRSGNKPDEPEVIFRAGYRAALKHLGLSE